MTSSNAVLVLILPTLVSQWRVGSSCEGVLCGSVSGLQMDVHLQPWQTPLVSLWCKCAQLSFHPPLRCCLKQPRVKSLNSPSSKAATLGVTWAPMGMRQAWDSQAHFSHPTCWEDFWGSSVADVTDRRVRGNSGNVMFSVGYCRYMLFCRGW